MDAFAYADDLAVIGYNRCRLFKTIDIIEEWAKDNNIVINKKKSGVILHNRRGHTPKANKGRIRDYPIQRWYKYLGVIIDSNLNFGEHIKYVKQKIEKGMKLLYMTGKKDIEE